MRPKPLISMAALLAAAAAMAGTILFKDGTRVTGADIVSIEDGRITVEKDKAKRSFALSAVQAYYQADMGESTGLPGEFADYAVRISQVDMPERGLDKNGKTTSCTVNYSITKKGEGKVKFPYFHLYVICSRNSETERRPIYRYCYPDEAKPKGKSYDRAAVMAKLTAFDRPVIGDGERYHVAGGGLGGREVSFDLKSVKGRRIIAYRLEAWGNDRLVAEKEEKIDILDARDVGERWWERY